VAYLTSTLWTGDAVAASQGGDEAYFRLEPNRREDSEPPAVDETVFADRNGLAVDALLRYAAYTDDERATSYARRARDHVLDELVAGGRVSHYADGPSDLLVDQARVLRGLATSWSVLGEPGPATAVADHTVDALTHDSGAFADGAAVEGEGLLDRALYPLDTNVEAAGALLDVGLLADEPAYVSKARDALAAFAAAADRMGVEVAAYATQAARIQSPTAVRVGTPAGTDLHRAALRLADHEAVVVPDDAGTDTGSARLVVSGETRGRASDPESLSTLLTDE
jgi:uncharacterized protein YyaL (SSP411 family)